ncbi:MAG: M56 family metallopeptidase [Oscillospiraceae bacterium]|nr:M56 family metallopeptidase [Oscillospiraceae bacterium]
MEAVFLYLLNHALTGTWMLAAVLVARLLLKKAPRRWVLLLWGLAALRLALPALPESRASLVPEATPVQIVGAIQTPETVMDEPREEDSGISRAEIASMVWAVGAAGMAIYAAVSNLRLRRRVRESVPLEGNVRLCDGITTPFLLGLMRPRVYLPAALPEADRTWVLAHEKAHLRRGDPWWKALGFVILSVYWFDPLVWLCWVLFCRDLEAACDEAVIRNYSVQDRQSYAETLLRCSASGFRLAVPLAFGEAGVKGRIRAIARYKKPAVVFSVLAVVLSLGLAGCFLTNPKTDEFVPIEVTVRDWLSSYYPSGALITDAQQAQEWYQMAENMAVDGEKRPYGYSYGLIFRDKGGEVRTFTIAENGVGCFTEMQENQLVPDWYSGGEALYQAADEAAKAARVNDVQVVPETQNIADGVRAALAEQYPMYEQAEFRAVSHALLAQTENSGNPAASIRICVIYQFEDYVREGRMLQPTQARRDIAVLDMTPMPDGTLQCAAFYDAKALTEDPSIAEPFRDVLENTQGYHYALAENCLAQAQAYARKLGENIEVGYLQPQFG